MKRHLLTLLLLSAVPLAAAAPAASTAKPAGPAASLLRVQLPADTRLDKPLTVVMPSGAPLGAVLNAIAKVSGLTLLTRDVPALPVTVSLKGLTARAALERLLSLYSDQVSAQLVGGTLIIAPPSVIAQLNPKSATTRTVVNVTLSATDAEGLTGLTGAQILPLGDRAVLSGTAQQVADASALLQPAPAPVASATPVEPTGPFRSNDAIGNADPDTVGKTLATLGNVTVTVAYGRAYLQANTAADLKTAQDILTQLRTDAPAKVAAPATPSAPTTTRQTVQTSLAAALVTRLATGTSDMLKLTPLEQGTYLVSGETKAVADFVGALKATETREAMRVTVMYKDAPKDALAGLQSQLPNVAAREVDGGIEVRGAPTEQVQASRYLAQLRETTPVVVKDEDVTVRVALGYAKPGTVASQLQSLYAPSTESKDKTTAAAAATPVAGAAPTITAISAQNAAPSAQTTPTAADAKTAGTPSTVLGVRIVPDERTRSVLLSGPSTVVTRMQRTVSDLDVKVSDVRMAIRVEQVSNSNGQDLGLNWSVGAGGFSIGQTDGTLSAGYKPGLALPNVTAQLATARSQGRSTTLLDTTFVAQDGIASDFTNGGQIILPTTTTTTSGTTSAGSTTSSSTTTSTYNYGMQLTLTPSLAPDGSVQVNVKMQLGQAPTTGVNNSTVLASQTFVTVATVKPGETIVLGGMLQQDDNNASKGVPGLSQIPLVGAFFGKKSNSVSNSVLLVTLAAGDRDDTRAPVPTAAAPQK